MLQDVEQRVIRRRQCWCHLRHKLQLATVSGEAESDGGADGRCPGFLVRHRVDCRRVWCGRWHRQLERRSKGIVEGLRGFCLQLLADLRRFPGDCLVVELKLPQTCSAVI